MERRLPELLVSGRPFDGAAVHLAQRDTTFAAVSRATLPEIEAFKKRMGWKFKWVSSFGNDFNCDYHVSFAKEEKAKGKVYYNYEMTEFPSEEASGRERVLSRRSGRNFSHLFQLCARARPDDVLMMGVLGGEELLGLLEGVVVDERRVDDLLGEDPLVAGRSSACLVVWPRATSSTSRRTSSLRCLFQTWRPV